MANVFEDIFLLSMAIVIIFCGGYYIQGTTDPLWIQILGIIACGALVVVIGYTLLVEEKYDGRK